MSLIKETIMQLYRFDTFGSLDNLRRHEGRMRRPGAGELLLRVRAVSLNYRDVAMVLGRYPVPAEPGHVPTSDAAAEVVAVGAGVTAYAPGDRVIGAFHPRWFGGERPATFEADHYGSGQDGWLCEEKVVSQEAVVPLPGGLSLEEGATLPCAAATAWNALAGPVPVRAGQTVLTQGTGGVSVFAVQLARMVGARVIATTSSADKAEKLRALGADDVIDYRSVPDWGTRARELTGGRGVDRVVEVGGSATFAQSLRAVAMDGEVVLVGFLGEEGTGVSAVDVLKSCARLRAITVGDRANLLDLGRAVAARGLRPAIDRIFTFADARAAFGHLAAGAHVGKVVITIGS